MSRSLRIGLGWLALVLGLVPAATGQPAKRDSAPTPPVTSQPATTSMTASVISVRSASTTAA